MRHKTVTNFSKWILTGLRYSFGFFWASGNTRVFTFHRLSKDARGSVGIIFSFALPVIIGITALGIDAAGFSRQNAALQSIADTSALAIAKELHLFQSRPAELKAAGEARVEAQLALTKFANLSHSVDVAIEPESVDVNITMVAQVLLPFGFWEENPMKVSANAITYGHLRLCVLGLHGSKSDTIKADNGATITAPECAIQSNSSDANGLLSKNGSALVSSFTCTAGGYEGSGFAPKPEVDCPVLDDPLASRQPPANSGCDFLDFKLDKGAHTIMPGHYCGGLTITNDAEVSAEPGVYVISGGKFEVGNEASLRGDYVSFYFQDDAATLVFKDNAIVELGAPKEGPMAGMLFFENPAAPEGRNFEVSSDAARKLLGTIYLPKGTFKTGGKGTVADASAYTIIVANRIDLDGANLFVNADYGGSDVPVPSGVGPSSGMVRLNR